MILGKIEKTSIEFLSYALSDKLNHDFVISKEDYQPIFQELQQHAVATLPADLLPHLHNICEDVLDQWNELILQQIYFYTKYKHAQNAIVAAFNTNNISFVILKGTSASCYYPNPQYRTMGDIDIFTKREDIDKACIVLEEIGYSRLELENDFGRTIKYVKGLFEVEIHRYYTSLNDPEKAEYLDNLILNNIREGKTKLPDNINGLVLLEHIGDHLEHGLGLRQIIDWMMYVRNCLDDQKWTTWFREQAEIIGLDKLAITVTRMCQLYLGLDEMILWPHTADEKVCKDLIAYIMASGNFGRKENDIQKRGTVEIMINHQSIQDMIRLLQRYGESNWKVLERHSALKPFAWIYQIGHSIHKRIKNKVRMGELIQEYFEGKARKELFDKLGVKQYSKGLAVRKGDHFEVI